MSAILETRGLCKEFGAVSAAKDVNVSISKGEVVGVIGSNGAGKTTFINMVTGYLKPSRGEILFNGQSIIGRTPRAITRAGMARSFQVAQLFPELTVLDNLLIALAAAESPFPSLLRPLRNGARIARAEAILSEFSILAWADNKVTAVPQGVRKLIDIAMALIGDPQMLLLDEPTSGVSAEEKTQLMDTVMQVVSRHQVTVLFVEHDMDVVRRYVSRILAFYSGEVLADGPPQTVLANARVQQLVTGGQRAHKGANA
ncbi:MULTISPECIES: ABC transporter ATP-binding protein [Pseudomonas]|uniref:Branched-chain amino acid transport system ATP-binding protein n=1 Tax=Pseudomonas hunanensis TaxID=1247546 RepID=A0ACC6JYV3_9PSED|nr:MULTISPECIES: ABC transporter ATP-binding protein [Pseudomonas]MBP2262189.1 branched-chain amino acid transport system ATP-binding protein [Pseudomonas sp. BP8]MDR6711399.1 branched-chain amino acid transport system ATP-binding protein [Pseudomonas hunanensis]HDS1733115.1 ABC transporter ATP-binding protein [Pseudomonas putida]